MNRRKKLIVLPELQLRMIRQAAFWPLATLVIASTIVGIAWRQVLGEAAELEGQFHSLAWLLAAFALLVGSAVFVILYQAMLFSNRVAGPVYQIHKALAAVREGDLCIRVKLRDKDLLTETADELNKTLQILEQRVVAAEQRILARPSVEAAPSLLTSNAPAAAVRGALSDS